MAHIPFRVVLSASFPVLPPFRCKLRGTALVISHVLQFTIHARCNPQNQSQVPYLDHLDWMRPRSYGFAVRVMRRGGAACRPDRGIVRRARWRGVSAPE